MLDPTKTYKREVAILALIALYALAIWGGYDERMKYVVEIMTMPTWLFALGAFGLDAVSKQWKGKQ